MIGGLFPWQEPTCQEFTFNPFWSSQAEGTAWTMSGRCALVHILRDHQQSQGSNASPKRAYLPAYTCETVVAPFLKEGYNIHYYTLDDHLIPQLDEHELLPGTLVLFCAYYGFKTYLKAKLNGTAIEDFEAFLSHVKSCACTIVFDLTHSLLDENPLPHTWDYAAGSYRKWLAVCSGGIALKHHEPFLVSCSPPHTEHLALRQAALLQAARRDQAQTPEELAAASTKVDSLFWEGESLLRRIFNNSASDQKSVRLLEKTDYERIRLARRQNYGTLLKALPISSSNWKIVFPELQSGACPSHFTIFSEKRDSLIKHLQARTIKASVYWPALSIADNAQAQANNQDICSRVLSLPCDQRYQAEDMYQVAQALRDWNVYRKE